MDYERLLFVILAIVLVLAIVKGPVVWQARKARGRQLEGLAEVLPQGRAPNGRYLFYFWSPSCGMCRSTTTIINEMMEERDDVFSLNVLDYIEFCREAGVMGTPSFLLVDGGRVVELAVGGRSSKQLLAMLQG